jgi:hypothetical protein
MLSRRWIVNGLLILAILLVAFAGYRLDNPSATAPPPVAGGNTDIGHIEIETENARLSLARDAEGWKFLDPVRWPADRATVERLLYLADTGGVTPLDAKSADLAMLGLDEPVARLRLGDTRVSFGITNNIGGRRYTMIDSELFLLADTQLPFILQGLPGLVDRRLLPPQFTMATLALPDLELRRDGHGTWQAVGRDDIAAARLQELAGSWQSLQASRVAAYDDSRAVRAGITAELTDGEHLEYLLLSVDPEIVIANPALRLQYHFRRGFYGRLILPIDDENPA